MSAATTAPAAASMLAALKRMPIFEGIDPGALETAAARSVLIAVQPGQAVMKGADKTTSVLFVLEGSVRVSLQTASGEHTRILRDYQRGEFVGELAAIDGMPRSASVEALTRSRLCSMPAPAFLGLATGSPLVALRLMQILAARIRAQNQALLHHTTLPVRLRIVSELLKLARPSVDGSLAVSPPPTHHDLADRIGSRRETVSREIGGLVREGLLRRTTGAIALPHPTALRALLERGSP